MFPVYRHMNPYNYQREPNSYPCQYNSGWGVMPSQMKADPFRHPSVFVTPSNDNACHSCTGCHSGCCHHSYPPNYYNFRPQFSHVQPPPQFYYYGPYPPYPDACPAYFIPPPHYSADRALYDYDKSQNHCCGCPNHTCHQDDRSSVTEERKPEKVQDRNVPGLIHLPDHPSPVIRVPTSSIKGREGDAASQLQPGCWNGWMPLDINSLRGSIQEDGGKKNQHDEDSEVKKRATFPIIWIPGYDIPEGEGKELMEITPKSVNDWPSKFKIVPLKFIENGNHGEQPKAAQEEPSNHIHPDAPVEKESEIKMIPVKEMEERTRKEASMLEQEEKADEKKAAKPVKRKEESEVSKAPVEKKSEIKTIPVKEMGERAQKEPSLLKQEEKADEKKAAKPGKQKEESEVSEASEKKQSSPGRSSKLPPVCLRVDPLPRKKSSNGASRSPSPPGLKEKRNHQQEQHNEEKSPQKESSDAIAEKVIPIVDVKNDRLSWEEKQQKLIKNIPVACSEEPSMESLSQETAKGENSLKAQDLIEGSEQGGKKDPEEKMSFEAGGAQKIVVDDGQAESLENKEVKERDGRKRVLSQIDAAVIIQSAYRGFEVRRWQLLQKLKKIAKIQEEAGRIRTQVQTIEASPEGLDAKQRMVIGEAIMNLLLQLDTIQGLHSRVRDVRKTVARELVCLQEKLDLLGSRNTGERGPAKIEGDSKAKDSEADSSRNVEQHGPAKTKEDSNAKDSEAAFVSSSAATLEQESGQEKIDSLGSHIAEEHEPGNVEGELKATDVEAAFVSSSADSLEQESFKHDALEDKSNSISNVAELSDIELKIIDLPSTDAAALAPNPSPLGEASPLLESMPPAENKPYSDVLDRPDSESGTASCTLLSEPSHEKDTELTLVTEPASEQAVVLPNEEPVPEQSTTLSLVTEPASGEDIGQSAKLYNSSESLFTRNQETDSQGKGHEDMTRGEANEAEVDASSNAPLVGIEQEEHKTALIDPKVEEFATVCHKLEDPRTLDAEPVLCTADENKSQPEAVLCPVQKEGEKNVLGDLTLPPVVEGCDTVQSIDNVAASSGHVRSPEHDMQVDNIRVAEKLEVSVIENKIFSAGANDEENQLNVSVQEIGHPTMNVPPADEHATSDAVYTPAVESESCALILNEDPYSPPSHVLEEMSKESENPDQSSADSNKEEKKLLEENEKLREMLEKLLEAGKEQMGVISNLNGRVKDLERKLAQKKKKRGAKVKVNGPHKLQSCEVPV